ncbi:MAG TPA: glycosyltransferase, partial [Ignavibacteria bacterium]
MTIVIFGDSFSFPEGEAATNRVHTYAKGFYENGLRVHVICFGNEYDNVSDGTINGIYFYHPFGQRRRSKYFIIRRWQKFIKYFRTITLIREINKNDKIIAFNCWTQLLLTQLFAFILSKYFKTNIILERSEHPLRNYQDSFFRQIQGNLKLYLETKLCSDIFCISNYLMDFYKNRGFSQRKLFLVPSTVDTGRFNYRFNSPFSFNYILYCGSLTILKDGVNILIESFTKISEKYPQINLVLIGKGDSFKDEMIIKDLVKTLNIEKRVIFLGQLSRIVVPAYLSNAKILALARPQSIIADAGFPSKLTEYL